MHVNHKSISRQIITQKKLSSKLCACKQKHSSVVGRLTETDQIQIRDDTTSRACLRTYCYTGITTIDTTRIISDFQPTKYRMPYITFKYPLSNKQPCMSPRSQYHVKSSRKRSFFLLQAVRMQAKTQLSRGTPHRN